MTAGQQLRLRSCVDVVLVLCVLSKLKMASLVHTASHSLHNSWSWVISNPLLRKNHKKSEQSARAALLPNSSHSPRWFVSRGRCAAANNERRSQPRVGCNFLQKLKTLVSILQNKLPQQLQGLQ